MLKVLTIGSGTIVDTMTDAIARAEGIRHEAVYSRDDARAASFAMRHGVGLYGTDKAALMADERVNTVYVASPNSCHYRDAKLALENGCHVLLEKPFTDTRAEAEELYALAEEKDLFLMEAISTIHTPVFKTVKSWLEKIGDIHLAAFNYSQYSSRYTQYRDGIVTNVFDPAYSGGALRDINVYNMHVMTALFGAAHYAVYDANRGYNGIDTSGILTADFGDHKAVCIGAKDCDGDNRVSTQGSLGRITVTVGGNLWTEAELIMRNGERENAKSDPAVNRLLYEVQAFESMVRTHDREAYEACKAESLAVMSLFDMVK